MSVKEQIAGWLSDKLANELANISYYICVTF